MSTQPILCSCMLFIHGQMSYYASLVDSLLIEFLESGEKKGKIHRKLLFAGQFML